MVSISGLFKAAGRLVFDPKFQDTAAKRIQDAMIANKAAGVNRFKNFHQTVGDAFVKANRESAKTPLLKSMKEEAVTLPSALKDAWVKNKGAWAKTKGIFGQLGKRMPLIGAAIMTIFELPNIISAFKDKGFVGGCTEILKSGSRLIGGMAFGAIGQALIPIPVVGGIIGYMVGDWLTSKIVGKSHSEKKAEDEEQQNALIQNLMQQQNPYVQNYASNPYASNPYAYDTNSYAQNQSTPQMTMTPQQTMAMGQMLYGGGNMTDDFMAMNSGINNLGFTPNKINYMV